MAITVEARTSIIELVVGMFGAAPGASVLSDLVAAYEKGQTIKQIAANLANTTEFKSIFPTFLTNAEFATKVVDQLVGTEVVAAEKAAAVTTLTAMLNAGASRSSVFVDAIDAVDAITSTNTAWANAGAALDNKVAVAVYYSVDKQLSGTTLAGLQDVIRTVTSAPASVTAANNVIDGTSTVGGTFTFTTGVDALVGTKNDDSFIASDTTYTGLDTVNGGDGVDTLTLSDVAGATIVLTKATVSSVEKLVLNSATGLAAGAADISKWSALTDATVSLNAAAAGQTVTASTTLANLTINNTAAQALTVVGGSGALVVSNGAAAVDVGTAVTANSYASAKFTGGTTVGIIDRSGTAAAVGSKLTSVSLDGNTGAATLEGKGLTSVTIANGVAASDVTITNATAAHTQNLTLNKNATGVVITDATATTVNVATTGSASAVALAVAAATTINTSGSVGLTLDTTGAIYTKLATVNIASTGAVSADLSGAAALTSVVATTSTGANTITLDSTKVTYAGGSGVDKVTVAVTATKAIDGGAGTDDVIVLNGAAGAAQVGTKATGFEVIGLGAAATGSYDAAGFSKLTHGAVTAAVTYTKVSAAPALTITATPGFASEVQLKDDTGTSDALSIKITGAAAIVANTVTAAGVESVSINSDDTATTPAGGFAHTLTLVATSAPSITITGDAGLTLTNANTALTLVDASAVTKGVFSFTSGALTKDATINGGAGADVINAGAATKVVTVNGGAGNDTITTGAGADVINAGDGDDSITSGTGLDAVNVGAGTDTFVVTGNANGNVYASITGMAAGDKIDFLAGGGAATFVTAAITLAPTAAFADFLQAATAGAAERVTWFQYGGDTYVVHDVNAAATFQNGALAGDQVVKLVGTVNLATATLDGAVTNVLTLA